MARRGEDRQVIYLAHPIDHNHRDLEADLDYISSLCKRAGNDAVFIPGRAWNHVDISQDSNIQTVNLAAIDNSDAVIAYWPRGIESVGVPLEIAHAIQTGTPVLLIRGDGTCPVSMMPFNVATLSESVLENEERLLAAIADLLIEGETKQKPMVATFDGHGDQPEAALPGDAGFDISYHGDEEIIIQPGEKANIPSGISYQMPPGYWSLILGRSSTFSKRGLLVPPSVIDAGYTGPIFAICWNVGKTAEVIKPGDRLAQIIPMPLAAEFMNWEHGPLQQTARGSNGFGSTGA